MSDAAAGAADDEDIIIHIIQGKNEIRRKVYQFQWKAKKTASFYLPNNKWSSSRRS